ncbi:cadherin repeat domain-containing protein [Synechococcus sp. CS-1330]|nr:cadherin repeat domain-containing protein [Synechococcus sp. CS-1330]
MAISSAATNLLGALLPEWHLLLQGWSANGRLTAAAKEALLLNGEPGALTDLTSQWSAGVFSALPPIVLLSSADINGALGAYAISTGTIYLNADWLAGASKEQVIAVLTEELGHHLDGLLNAVDTPGDEGEYFAALLSGQMLSESAERHLIKNNSTDHGLVLVEQNKVAAEFSSAYSINGSSFRTSYLEKSSIPFDLAAVLGPTIGVSASNLKIYVRDALKSRDGSYYILGVYDDIANNDPQSTTFFAEQGVETGRIFIARISDSGSLLSWNLQSYSGASARFGGGLIDIAADGSSRVIININTNDGSSVQLNSVSAPSNPTDSRYQRGGFIVSVSANGTTQWTTAVTDFEPEAGMPGFSPNVTWGEYAQKVIISPDGTSYVYVGDINWYAPKYIIKLDKTGAVEWKSANLFGTKLNSSGASYSPYGGVIGLDADLNPIVAANTGNATAGMVTVPLWVVDKVTGEISGPYGTATTENELWENWLFDVSQIPGGVWIANEGPTDLTLTSTGINENSPAGTVIGTLAATDPDAGSTFTYALATGNGTNDADNNLVEIANGNQVRVKSGAVIDFETNPLLNLNIRVTDNGNPGLTYDKTVTASVIDINETPTDLIFTSSGVQENSATATVIGTLSATDPDAGSSFTFALVGGDGTNDADNNLVEIVGNEVRVKSGASIDFETNPLLNLNIQVTDNGTPGLSFTKAVTASVIDLNEAPTDLIFTSSGVQENSPAATVIGTLSATDPDAGSTFTYALVAGNGTNDADNALVEIVSNEVRVKSGASIDFETNPTLNLNIQVTDNGTPGLTYTKAVTATVLDVNEAPTSPLFINGVSTSNATPILISNYSSPGVQSNSVTPLGAGTGASVEQITTTRVNIGTTRKPKYVNQTSYSLIDRFTDVDGITFTAGGAANSISAQGVAGDNQRPAFDGQLIADGGLNRDIITGGSYRNWLIGGGIFSESQTQKRIVIDTLIGTKGALDVFDLRTSDFTSDAYSASNTGSALTTNYTKGEDHIVLSKGEESYKINSLSKTIGRGKSKTKVTFGYQVFSGSELVATIAPASGTSFTGSALNDLSILYGQTGDPTETLFNGQPLFFG